MVDRLVAAGTHRKFSNAIFVILALDGVEGIDFDGLVDPKKEMKLGEVVSKYVIKPFRRGLEVEASVFFDAAKGIYLARSYCEREDLRNALLL